LDVVRWVAGAVLLALAWVSCTSSGSGGNSSLQAEPTPIIEAIPGVQDIRLAAANWSFVPNDITVAPGESIRFIITNTWTVAHTITFDDSGIVVDLTLEPGGTKIAEVLSVDAGIDVRFWCRFHDYIGMNGRFHVDSGT
jgi:plastocyanin